MSLKSAPAGTGLREIDTVNVLHAESVLSVPSDLREHRFLLECRVEDRMPDDLLFEPPGQAPFQSFRDYAMRQIAERHDMDQVYIPNHVIVEDDGSLSVEGLAIKKNSDLVKWRVQLCISIEG